MLLADGGALMVGTLIAGTITWLISHRQCRDNSGRRARFTVQVPASAPSDIATLGPSASMAIREDRPMQSAMSHGRRRNASCLSGDSTSSAPRPIPGTIGVWEAFSFLPMVIGSDFSSPNRWKDRVCRWTTDSYRGCTDLNAGVWADDKDSTSAAGRG